MSMGILSRIRALVTGAPEVGTETDPRLALVEEHVALMEHRALSSIESAVRQGRLSAEEAVMYRRRLRVENGDGGSGGRE